MNEDYIFYCKTSQAYQIKILSDILSNIIKIACFQLYSGGINLRMMDCNQKILIDLKLEKDNFNFFFYNSSFIEKEILNVGLTLSHMQRQIKSIKKRDSIEIYILKNKPDEISFKLLPKDLTLSRITISSLKIQKIHHINVELPPPYPHSILVNTSEFTKLIKEMSNVSNILFVRGTAFFIKFFSDLAQVFSRETIIGNYTKENDDGNFIYEEKFSIAVFNKVLKLSGLNNVCKIKFSTAMPIQLSCEVGTLGNLSIFFKAYAEEEEAYNNILM